MHLTAFAWSIRIAIARMAAGDLIVAVNAPGARKVRALAMDCAAWTQANAIAMLLGNILAQHRKVPTVIVR